MVGCIRVNKANIVRWLGIVAAVITIYVFFAEPRSGVDSTHRPNNTVIIGGDVSSHAQSSGPNSSATSNVNINNNVNIIDNRVSAEKGATVIVRP